MANLNINRNVTDVFYRYKMPRLIAKVRRPGESLWAPIVISYSERVLKDPKKEEKVVWSAAMCVSMD